MWTSQAQRGAQKSLPEPRAGYFGRVIILYSLNCFSFQVWSPGPMLLRHTPAQEMAFQRVGFVGSGPSLESWTLGCSLSDPGTGPRSSVKTESFVILPVSHFLLLSPVKMTAVSVIASDSVRRKGESKSQQNRLWGLGGCAV